MYAYCAAVVSQLSAAQQATLWALASFVRNGSSETWVSLPTVAKRMGLDLRNVQRHVRALIDAGVIAETERPGHSTLWRFPVHPALGVVHTPGEIATGETATPGEIASGEIAADPWRNRALTPGEIATRTTKGTTKELGAREAGAVDNSEAAPIGIEAVEVSEEMPAWLSERIQARKLEQPRMMWEADFDRTVAADG